MAVRIGHSSIIATSTCPLSVFRIKIVPSYVGEMVSAGPTVPDHFSVCIPSHEASVLPPACNRLPVWRKRFYLYSSVLPFRVSTASGGECKVPQKVELFEKSCMNPLRWGAGVSISVRVCDQLDEENIGYSPASKPVVGLNICNARS